MDELILSQNIGTPNQETLDNMQSIAEEVMPASQLGKIEAAMETPQHLISAVLIERTMTTGRNHG